jgi:hypothetical protein
MLMLMLMLMLSPMPMPMPKSMPSPKPPLSVQTGAAKTKPPAKGGFVCVSVQRKCRCAALNPGRNTQNA